MQSLEAIRLLSSRDATTPAFQAPCPVRRFAGTFAGACPPSASAPHAALPAAGQLSFIFILLNVSRCFAGMYLKTKQKIPQRQKLALSCVSSLSLTLFAKYPCFKDLSTGHPCLVPCVRLLPILMAVFFPVPCPGDGHSRCLQLCATTRDAAVNSASCALADLGARGALELHTQGWDLSQWQQAAPQAARCPRCPQWGTGLFPRKPCHGASTQLSNPPYSDSRCQSLFVWFFFWVCISLALPILGPRAFLFGSLPSGPWLRCHYSHDALLEVAVEGVRLVVLDLAVLHGAAPQVVIELRAVDGRARLLILGGVLADPEVDVLGQETARSPCLGVQGDGVRGRLSPGRRPSPREEHRLPGRVGGLGLSLRSAPGQPSRSSHVQGRRQLAAIQLREPGEGLSQAGLRPYRAPAALIRGQCLLS